MLLINHNAWACNGAGRKRCPRLRKGQCSRYVYVFNALVPAECGVQARATLINLGLLHKQLLLCNCRRQLFFMVMEVMKVGLDRVVSPS